MRIRFHRKGWEQYEYWRQTDPRMTTKIGKLIADIQRHPFEGLGKPEPLKHEWAGYWSRRIDEQHRLIYAVEDDAIVIAQCRFHYSD